MPNYRFDPLPINHEVSEHKGCLDQISYFTYIITSKKL